MRKLIVEEVENFRRMVSRFSLLVRRAELTFLRIRKVRPPTRQNSGSKRQDAAPLPVPSRDTIMSSPGGQNGEDQKNFATRMDSPEHEEIPGDELEKELAGHQR